MKAKNAPRQPAVRRSSPSERDKWLIETLSKMDALQTTTSEDPPEYYPGFVFIDLLDELYYGRTELEAIDAAVHGRAYKIEGESLEEKYDRNYRHLPGSHIDTAAHSSGGSLFSVLTHRDQGREADVPRQRLAGD
jgi:hypothetical protein